MKTFIFSALALGMMASCSNTEVEGIDVVDNGEPVAIQLSAGVETTTGVTRAAIEDGNKFKAIVLGWESNTEMTEFATEPSWNATSSDINTSGNTPSITVPGKYYSTEDGYKTYMKAFYVDGATATQEAQTSTYALDKKDGSVDILMTTAAVYGDKTTPAGALTFAHPLTKLIFKGKAGVGLANDVKLTSIHLLGMSVPEKINLGTNEVLFGTAQEVEVPIIFTDAITTTEETASTAVMVKPISGKFNIKVVTNKKTYSSVEVTLSSVAEHADGKGVAYTVTLTFRDEISTSASVTEWATGSGSGTVG